MTARRRTLLALLSAFAVASIHARPATPEQQRRGAAGLSSPAVPT